VKGHDLLLRAFAELGTGPSPRVTLVLIGDGELRDPIERRIAQLGLGGSVILHGEVADARSTYGALDIVVQASSEEGLPNAMLEAAAAGRGIVATAAGGTGEIVRDGLTGLLVPIDDAAALSTAMRRLVEDLVLRERLGEGARRHVLATFGMDRMVAEFAALYSGLVARGTR
jgi:glycosyltransferase involved in cell wall biosynthesis